MRSDLANRFLGLRLNDWTSIVVFLAGLAWFWLHRNTFDDSPYTHPLAETTAGAEAETETHAESEAESKASDADAETKDDAEAEAKAGADGEDAVETRTDDQADVEAGSETKSETVASGEVIGDDEHLEGPDAAVPGEPVEVESDSQSRP